MEGEGRGRLGSFLIGGLIGSAAAVVASGRVHVRRRRGTRGTPAGLAAFEQAPCYQELVAHEAAEGEPDGAPPEH
ncbi:MAG: hypothetical protein M3123_01905 [Actinomycetota bacterium]|nr:hypothetical protein [Actinomycetota bacterium]